MREFNGVYVNACYRSGPCLFGEQVKVKKESYWDYYDSAQRSFVFLQCKIHQKYYTPGVLQIEDAEKYQSALATESYEHPDLQLADQNGRWMTRSDDPGCYYQEPYEEPKTCSICDIVCDLRDRTKYLEPDGTCPYPDPPPAPIYWKIDDQARPCQDFLHPLMLSNIDAINKKRRRAAKAHVWKYLQQPRWMHALINSGQRMIDVWKRNYQPVTFYYRSFETILLYLKSIPADNRTGSFLQHVRGNLEKSPSYKHLLRESDYERGLLDKIDRMVAQAEASLGRRGYAAGSGNPGA